MAEPKSPRKKLVRRSIPYQDRYVALPDAVYLTLRVSGLAPEQIQARIEAVEGQKRIQEQKQQALARKRLAYRLKRALQNILSMPMTDEQVDLAIAAEEYQQQHQAYISQGYDRPQIDQLRLSDLYANVSNFYAALGSPNMMPMNDALVRANPQIAATQLQFGLDNPALTALLIAAPAGGGTGALSAARTAAGAALKESAPIATRALRATANGTRAFGTTLVLNTPRVLGTLAVNAVPVAAAAAEFPDDPNQQGGGQEEGSVMPWIVGSGALLLGGRNWIKNGSPFRFSPKVEATANKFVYTPDKRWFTWERPSTWEATTREALAGNVKPTILAEWNAVVADPVKTGEFKTKYGLSETVGTGRKAKTTPWTDAQVSLAIQSGDFSSFKGLPDPNNYVLTGPTSQQVRWAQLRNAGRLGLGALGAWNAYNFFFNNESNTPAAPQLPEASEFGQGYEEVDASLNNMPTSVVDTIRAIPRDSVPPVNPQQIFNWDPRQ